MIRRGRREWLTHTRESIEDHPTFMMLTHTKEPSRSPHLHNPEGEEGIEIGSAVN
jgi:hypothetical protein